MSRGQEVLWPARFLGGVGILGRGMDADRRGLVSCGRGLVLYAGRDAREI